MGKITDKPTFQCNCLFWALKAWWLWGGRIKFKKSTTWFGFHVTWISQFGEEYEYTLTKPKKQKWWYVPFCYSGVIKQVKRK